MESIEKLRTAARNMAKGRPLEEHEECNLLLVIANEIEREIAEKYMLLPVDADGVPIHVGDVVSLKGGEPFEVGGVRDTRSQWHVFPYDLQRWYSPLDLHHVKPDPLKELLSELANDVWEASCTCQTTWSDSGLDGIEERYAERIRELLGGDEE